MDDLVYLATQCWCQQKSYAQTSMPCFCVQRLARSTNVHDYSKSLSDMSRWSRSVGSIDEAQIEQMRKVRNQTRIGAAARSNGNGRGTKQSKVMIGSDRLDD